MVMQGVVLLIDTTPLVVEQRYTHRGTSTFKTACRPFMECESRGILESDIHLLYVKGSGERIDH